MKGLLYYNLQLLQNYSAVAIGDDMENMRKNKVKTGRDTTIMNIIIVIVIGGFCILCLIPFIMMIGSSFETEYNLAHYGYTFWPRKFSLSAYELILKDGQILQAYKVTIFMTVIGTFLSMLMTMMMAYPLSLGKLKGNTFLTFFVYFTMLFGGGLVPTYLLISKYLHMRNSIWVLILPVMFSAWNMFLMRNFFKGVPVELAESAYVDGANDLQILYKIILPVSVPGIATISLFYALGYWNQWYNAMLYIDDSKLYPLQYYIMNILRYTESFKLMAMYTSVNSTELPTTSIKMATTVVTIGPIVFIYPFVQKYFTSGLTVGAIKG